MGRRGVEPDVISFSAAISACEKGGQWERALSLLEEMGRRGVEPDVVSFNAALDAVCAQQPVQARALWLRGVGLGHYVGFESNERGHPKLDLHNLSEGAAETAVRWWLEERLPLLSNPPEQLIIVTGWGKTRAAYQNGDVRGRIERVLQEMGAKMLPTDNRGRLLVDVTAQR